MQDGKLFFLWLILIFRNHWWMFIFFLAFRLIKIQLKHIFHFHFTFFIPYKLQPLLIYYADAVKFKCRYATFSIFIYKCFEGLFGACKPIKWTFRVKLTKKNYLQVEALSSSLYALDQWFSTFVNPWTPFYLFGGRGVNADFIEYKKPPS